LEPCWVYLSIRVFNSNYRGLTTGGNICKLFTKILNTHLDNFLIKRNIVSREQSGFCKGKRTSDHIFALKTLIDKYTQQSSNPFLNMGTIVPFAHDLGNIPVVE
jgi:hypothetical protein